MACSSNKENAPFQFSSNVHNLTMSEIHDMHSFWAVTVVTLRQQGGVGTGGGTFPMATSPSHIQFP